MSPAEGPADATAVTADVLARVPAVGLGWPEATAVPRSGEVPGTDVGNGWPADAVADAPSR